MLPILIVITLILAIIGFYVLRKRRFEAALKKRVESFVEQTKTRRFLVPGSDDLPAQTDICNAFKPFDGITYSLTLFDADGTHETITDYSQEALDTFIKTGQWNLISERYSSTEGGRTMQFVRPKLT